MMRDLFAYHGPHMDGQNHRRTISRSYTRQAVNSLRQTTISFLFFVGLSPYVRTELNILTCEMRSCQPIRLSPAAARMRAEYVSPPSSLCSRVFRLPLYTAWSRNNTHYGAHTHLKSIDYFWASAENCLLILAGFLHTVPMQLACFPRY